MLCSLSFSQPWRANQDSLILADVLPPPTSVLSTTQAPGQEEPTASPFVLCRLSWALGWWSALAHLLVPGLGMWAQAGLTHLPAPTFTESQADQGRSQWDRPL